MLLIYEGLEGYVVKMVQIDRFYCRNLVKETTFHVLHIMGKYVSIIINRKLR